MSAGWPDPIATGCAVAGMRGDGDAEREEGVAIGEAGGGNCVADGIDALRCKGDDAAFRRDADRYWSRVAGGEGTVAAIVCMDGVGAGG